MKELKRLITAAKERMKTESLTVRSNSDGWHLTKNGPSKEDLQHTTFDQVLARLREWAGEPEPEPEPMTVAELMALRDRAATATANNVTLTVENKGYSLCRNCECYVMHGTLDQVVDTLREWATPKLPEFTTLENVPVAWIQYRATGSAVGTINARQVDEICRATMAKLQSQ